MSGQLKSQITRNDSTSTVYNGPKVFRTPVIRIPVWFDKFSATYSPVFPMEISIIFYYYYYYRISHFSALAGKYSHILGCSNSRIRLGGLICSLKSFLQLNTCQELQIFGVVYMYSGAS